MSRDPRILTHPGLDPLWESMERERRTQQLVAVVLMLAGLATVVLGLLTRNGFFPLAGGALATFSLWWLFRILSNQPLAALRRRLRTEPESIAWVYGTHTQRLPFGLRMFNQGTLYFVGPDGDRESVSLPPKHLMMVTKTLNRVLPEAEFGFTEERERKYAK